MNRSEARHRLSSAQKSNRGAGAYSRWINRPSGRQFAVLAYSAGLTPNQVSLISAAFSYAGIAAIAVLKPQWPTAVAITIALLVGYALDSADGQLARIRGGGSPAGEWLDHVLDVIKISSFHLAIAIMWFRQYDLSSDALLLIPLAFCAVSVTFFFAITLTDLLRRIARAAVGSPSVTTASVNPTESAPVGRSLAALPYDYGLFCLVLLLSPVQAAFILVYGVLLALNGATLLIGCARWFLELSTMRAAPVRERS